MLRQVNLIAIVLTISIGSYVLLAGSTVGTFTVQYDEFTDLLIAKSFSSAPLHGSSRDGSQARLPMYTTAAAGFLMKMVNPEAELLDLLPVSRWISILLNALVILLTFILGYRIFNLSTAMFAIVLLAFSPYFLQFGRDALTQGDAFCPAAVVATLIAFERFVCRRTTFWLASVALCLAIAITSKFFLFILIPALITFHLLQHLKNKFEVASTYIYSEKIVPQFATPWRYLSMAAFSGFLAVSALIINLNRYKFEPELSNYMYKVSMCIWILSLIGIGLSFLSCLNKFCGSRFYFVKCDSRWSLKSGWIAIFSLTIAASLSICPAHIFNPGIFAQVAGRASYFDGQVLGGMLLDALRLYFGLILFKTGLPFGIALSFALIFAVRESLRNKWLLMINIVLVYYITMIVFLPLIQPYWLMSIYPIMILVLSAMIVRITQRIQSRILLFSWKGTIAFAFVWLLVGIFFVYPTFGYYGYELIGNNWLGKDSRGYRGVVVITNDGSTEALKWCQKNVPPGSVVLSFLDDFHIINYLKQKNKISFELKHSLQFKEKNMLNKELELSDYVIARLIPDFTDSPFDYSIFTSRFSTVPIHEIVRGRGIYKMPVIKIFQRKP
jgi:hypothetical protein